MGAAFRASAGSGESGHALRGFRLRGFGLRVHPHRAFSVLHALWIGAGAGIHALRGRARHSGFGFVMFGVSVVAAESGCG